MPYFYTYARVSTEQQQTLKAQQDICEHYIRMQLNSPSGEYADYEYGGYFSEAISGRKYGWLQREAGSHLASKLKQGDIIVVSKFDRLVRGARDIHDIMDHLDRVGARFIALDLQLDSSSSSGRAVLEIMSSIKAMEVREIQSRTTQGLHVRKRDVGLFSCCVPGWTIPIKNAVAVDEVFRKMGVYGLHLVLSLDTRSRHRILNEALRNDTFYSMAMEWQRRIGTRRKRGTPISSTGLVGAVAYAAIDWPLMTNAEVSEAYFSKVCDDVKPWQNLDAIRTVYTLRRDGEWEWDDPSREVTEERLRALAAYRRKRKLGAKAVVA